MPQYLHSRTIHHSKVWRQGTCLSFVKRGKDYVSPSSFSRRWILGKSTYGRLGPGNGFPWNDLYIHSPWKIFLYSPCLKATAQRFRAQKLPLRGHEGQGLWISGLTSTTFPGAPGLLFCFTFKLLFEGRVLLLKISLWKAQLPWGTIEEVQAEKWHN